MRQPTPGDTVKCYYRGPHRGTVLDKADPRAWRQSIAFQDDDPDPARVQAHVERCLAQGLLRDIPVIWHFPDGDLMYWSDPQNLEVTNN